MWVHRIFGGLMVVMTSYFGVKAVTTVGKFINNEHSYFVFPLLLSVVFTAAFGAYANYSLNLNKDDKWNTAQLLENKAYHVVPAYGSMFFAGVALATGMHYYRISPKHFDAYPIEWVQYGLWAAVVLGAEAWHQWTIKDEKPF